MKKNNLTFIIVLIAGLLIGSILSQLFADVPWLSFLTRSAEISWEPSADLQVIRYDISLYFSLNLASLLGLAAAIWVYRKM